MCLTVEIRLLCDHSEYETVVVCQNSRLGYHRTGPSVAQLCPRPEFKRVDSTAICEGCLVDLLEEIRDEACGECREIIRVRFRDWEPLNLRREA
jgi:hypothetical protein